MGVSRSSFYDQPTVAHDDTAIVEAIAAICDEFEFYGWRRVRAELRHRGMIINHKKIRRLMREHALQPRIRRRYVATTNSDHDRPIHPNRTKELSHRSASGGKGGEKPGDRSLARWTDDQIHALTDSECQPLSFTLTGGQVADCTAGAKLLARLPPCQILHADKGYDSNPIRTQVEHRVAIPNNPPKANRKWKNCFSLYRGRNAIERMFCGLKDSRRVARRFDRNTPNFLAAIRIAAAVIFWL